MSSVPSVLDTVDVSSFLLGTPDEQRAVVNAVMRSLLTTGFLFLSVQPDLLLPPPADVESNHLPALFSAAESFFLLSSDEKNACISLDRAKRGYSPALTENFASLLGYVDSNDEVEKFRIGPLDPPSESLFSGLDKKTLKEARSHYYPNEWSKVSPTLAIQSKFHYRYMTSLAIVLLKILEIGLEYKDSYLVSCMTDHTSIMTFNYYANSTSRLDGINMAAHTDVSLFTILAQSSEGDGALEIQLPLSHEWIKVPYIANTYIVNVGDALQYWTRGRLLSTVHRVRSDKRRLSVAFFVAPRFNVEMSGEEGEETGLEYADWRRRRVKTAMRISQTRYG